MGPGEILSSAGPGDLRVQVCTPPRIGQQCLHGSASTANMATSRILGTTTTEILP